MCTYIIKFGTWFSLGVFINCKICFLYLIFDSILLLMCFRLHYLPITYLQSLSVAIFFQIIDINPLVLNSQIIHTIEDNIPNRTLTLLIMRCLITFQLQSCQRLGCIVNHSHGVYYQRQGCVVYYGHGVYCQIPGCAIHHNNKIRLFYLSYA